MSTQQKQQQQQQRPNLTPEQVAEQRRLKKEAKFRAKQARREAGKQKQKQKQKQQKQKHSSRDQTSGAAGGGKTGSRKAPSGGGGGRQRNLSTNERPKRAPDGQGLQFDDPKAVQKFKKRALVDRIAMSPQKQIDIFSHLPQYEKESSLSLQLSFDNTEIHPAIIRLGLQTAEGIVVDSDERSRRLIEAFILFFASYTPTKGAHDLRYDMQQQINPQVRFLIDCRPNSLPMGNVIRYIKSRVARLPAQIETFTAKQTLMEHLRNFSLHRMQLARLVIAQDAARKIRNGDVILTYLNSEILEQTLIHAWNTERKRFRVVIVDARPQLSGRKLLKRLCAHGIECSYTLLSGLSYVLAEVTKVMVGGTAMLSNGACLAPSGTAMVALMANAYHIPFIVCFETYKFHERHSLDSVVYNELGDPDELIRTRSEQGNLLTDWRDIPHLRLLNLIYDVTPAKYISMVVTEVGYIPVSSVPVVLREYHKHIAEEG